jgi:hypothetical protein
MPPNRQHPWLYSAVGMALLLQGCQPVMPTPPSHSDASLQAVDNMTPPPGHGAYTGTVADWPLWFVAHNFGAFSYSTYGCKVLYNNMLRVDDPDDVLQISSASIGSKYPENLDASYIGIANFPPPAKVTWRSKDGTPHEAAVDIGEIFKDRLIRHDVAREDIPETASIGPPDIILEVNDRTINVYMRARISLKKPRFPDRPHSNYQDDLIKVYTRTY